MTYFPLHGHNPKHQVKGLVAVCPEDVRTRPFVVLLLTVFIEPRAAIHFDSSQPPLLIEQVQLTHSFPESFSTIRPRVLTSSRKDPAQ